MGNYIRYPLPYHTCMHAVSVHLFLIASKMKFGNKGKSPIDNDVWELKTISLPLNVPTMCDMPMVHMQALSHN